MRIFGVRGLSAACPAPVPGGFASFLAYSNRTALHVTHIFSFNYIQLRSIKVNHTRRVRRWGSRVLFAAKKTKILRVSGGWRKLGERANLGESPTS
jgi:hypothetical protein